MWWASSLNLADGALGIATTLKLAMAVGDRDEVTFSEPVSTDLMDEERECGWSMSGGGTVDCAAAV